MEAFSGFITTMALFGLERVYVDRFNDCGNCVIREGGAHAELAFKQVRRTLVGCAGYDPMFAIQPMRKFMPTSWLGKIKSLWNTLNKIVVEGIKYCQFVVDAWRDRIYFEADPEVIEVCFKNTWVDNQKNYERLSIKWAQYALESFATWRGVVQNF